MRGSTVSPIRFLQLLESYIPVLSHSSLREYVHVMCVQKTNQVSILQNTT